MQVSVETIGTLGRRLTVAVPADQVEKEFSVRLQRLSKQVRIPGFRPGKVPLKMVEAQYGGKLMNEIAGDLIQTTFQEAIGSQGLRPAGEPRIQPKPLGRGQQLEYTVEFEIYPEVKRSDLAGVRIERPAVTVSGEDVERTLDTIRRQRATWSPVTREASKADRVTIDFTGRMHGKDFEGGKATQFPLVLGSGALIEGFEQGLVGAKIGETRDVNVTFPADYHNTSLAGQRAEFEVKVHEIAEPILPELNEEFAKQLGVQEGGMEKLLVELKANLEREAAARIRAVLRSRALKALLEANPVEVPQGLVAEEVQRLKKDVTGSAGPADEAALQKRAHNRVALGLVLAEIIRARGISSDPARVRARVEEMAAEYESPQEYIQWHYANPERLNGIQSLVMEEKVVEELLVTADVADKPVSFQELLKIETTIQ
jgi:trigger factor